jgi:hypothetical protein
MNKDMAITTYVDNTKIQLEDLSWLYKSWLLSGCNETSDLVIFHHPDVTIPYEDVIKIPLAPFHATSPLWKNYRFINSIQFMTSPEAKETVKNYKYCLRTDADVFLTKHFKHFRPRLPLFGSWPLVFTEEVSAKLSGIAAKLKLDYVHMHNVGTTVLYKTNDVIGYSKLQLQICEHLMLHEFPEEGSWPNWFRGVCTMYAGELAANHCFLRGITLGGIDCMSMSGDEISNFDLHIHAFHTAQYFSKHAFRRGEYDKMNPDELDISKINNYCLFIAKKSLDEIKILRDAIKEN